MSSASNAAAEMSGKSEAGSSGSSSGSNGTSLPGLAAGETCAYMSPNRNTGCRMPRPCDSCLATSGCLIDATGTCASVRDVRLNPTMDYRLAISQGLVLPKPTASAAAVSQQQMWQFPAGQVAYCDASDAVCRSCRMANFWRSRGTYPDSRYCLGDGGCVCIDVCERRWFVQPDCPMAGSSGSGLGGDSQDSLLDQGFVNNVWQAMVGAMLFVVLVFALMFRSRRRAETTRRREQDEERRRQEEVRRQQRQQVRASELGVNVLTLAGWETHRRDLLDKASAQSTTTPAGETVTTTVQEETAVEVAVREDHETAYVRMSEEGEGRLSGAPSGGAGGAAAAGGDAAAAERPSNTSSVSPTGGPAPALAPLSTTRTLRPTGVRTRRG